MDFSRFIKNLETSRSSTIERRWTSLDSLKISKPMRWNKGKRRKGDSKEESGSF